jgi:hypothetical protein
MTANRQTGYCRRCGVRLARDNARENVRRLSGQCP